MKAILKGKSYDTERATKVAWDGDYGPSDFNYWREHLYLTPKGSWFLHCEGGPLSKYASAFGRNRSDGEDIVPMSHDEAFAWLERYRKTEAIEKHFSDRVEEA